MIPKILLGIGVAAAAAIVLLPALTSKRSSATQAPGLDAAPGVAPTASGPGQAKPIAVKPGDLDQLATMVDLSESPDQGFKQDKWARAIPIAQSLLQKNCDCEQRNWLTQFVNVGNMALKGSPAYRNFAPILATMYRDDHELGTGVPSK